ncbi:MAG: hypothetical protein AAF270_02710 [Pseudomonadota bacterium]
MTELNASLAGDVRQQLLDTLALLVDVLKHERQVYWLQQLITARNEISRGDQHGLQRLLSLYGGPQALDDLTLADGARQSQLVKLRDSANQLASALRESRS